MSITANLNSLPSAERTHIVFFGRRNSGKSSLVNALTGQNLAIVSETAGTTTDPVFKAMEISGLGPCVIGDTAGFDDEGELGLMRVEKTKQAARRADIAVLVIEADRILDEEDTIYERRWLELFKKQKIKILWVLSKCDKAADEQIASAEAKIKRLDNTAENIITVSVKDQDSINAFKKSLMNAAESSAAPYITGSLIKPKDIVLLVMPQDIQAPKGRLILPQVQTLREILDRGCTALACTADNFSEALSSLKKAPDLIITDSQVFDYVYKNKPAESALTSFSVLFAAYKGDIKYYLKGAETLNNFDESKKILIAECCTHAPLNEDIGRVKLPRMLRKKFGQSLQIDTASGSDFPEDLTEYDLIIQCGACMFNRQHVISRINKAKEQNVPMSNYGIVIAKLTGILDCISLP